MRSPTVLVFQLAKSLMLEMDGDSDGEITEQELLDAFLLRQETLTTMLVNKVGRRGIVMASPPLILQVMQRALSVQFNILKD